jgi:hypothetical protein
MLSSYLPETVNRCLGKAYKQSGKVYPEYGRTLISKEISYWMYDRDSNSGNGTSPLRPDRFWGSYSPLFQMGN